MKVGLEKLDNHEEVTVRALLDSGATGLFMDTTFAREKGFKMEKLKKPLLVRNIDGTVNAGRAITHQVECNMFFKGHVERARMDVCNLGKTEVILRMLWLAAHNPEIDWEKGEVEIMRCPPICGKRKQEEKRKEAKKVERNKNKKMLKKLVPKRFWRWGKVFGKKEARKNASTKNLGPRHRVEGRIYTKKEKGILTVQGGKGGGTSICRRPAKERIHLPFQVTPNVTSTLHSKEEWHMENGAGLSTHKSVDDKEWVSLTPHCRHTGWGRKEKGIYKVGPEVGIQ